MTKTCKKPHFVEACCIQGYRTVLCFCSEVTTRLPHPPCCASDSGNLDLNGFMFPSSPRPETDLTETGLRQRPSRAASHVKSRPALNESLSGRRNVRRQPKPCPTKPIWAHLLSSKRKKYPYGYCRVNYSFVLVDFLFWSGLKSGNAESSEFKWLLKSEQTDPIF